MKTKKVDVLITGSDGNVVFKKDGFEVPEFWSDRAATIVASKYAMDSEYSAIDIIDRVVNQITQWGQAQGYFDCPINDKEETPEADQFREELRNILLNQRAAFNSPVFFNVGADTGTNQASACFILPSEDTMEAILEQNTVEGTIFKGGSGAGRNISKLRGKGEKLSNKGTSSGPVSFMKMYDATAGVIRSGGKTRRSAKLVCMDVDHPDIMEFIECKKKEEDKAKILIENGISTEEAYETVAFQNANHSIRVTDEFMKSVIDNSKWYLVERSNPANKTDINAKSVLRRTAEIAWETGDPGIQFDDAMNRDNPVPSVGKINSTNPCFTGDTRISTPKGLIPIKELCEKSFFSGDMGRVFTKDKELSTPVAFMCTGKNDILKVTLSDGREIKCTPNHNWYIEGEKVEAKDLEPGMIVTLGNDLELIESTRALDVFSDINDYRKTKCQVIDTDINFPTEVTPEFAEVLGHLTGDGWISEGKMYSVGWIFGKTYDEGTILFNKYKDILNSYFPVNVTTHHNGCNVLRYTRQPILEYFVSLGFKRCKAPEKTVPEFLFRTDKEIVGKYLRGYFGADGTVFGSKKGKDCAVNCCSTSKRLLQDVQLLLGILGIRSRIRIMKNPEMKTFSDGRTYESKTCYRLLVDTRDLVLFRDMVGFSIKYKNDILDSILLKRKDLIPYARRENENVTIKSVDLLPEKEITYNLTEPKNNLVYAQGVLISQCSEFSAVDNSSCNLASLNLVKYLYDNYKSFDYGLFHEDISVLITAMDILVDAADYPTDDIRYMTTKTRPLGLGFSNLGAMLMLKGLPYGSEEARALAGDITRSMTSFAYATSIELARKLKKSFYYFDDNKETNIELARRLTESDIIADGIKAHGLRNSQVTLLAPTGTIAFLMDCDTSGIEPLFALKSYKTLAGGGVMELDYPCVEEAKRLYTDKDGKFNSEILNTANNLSWKDHIDMMVACQKHLNGSISKTVNLPADATVQEIEDAYMYAWEKGLKCLAVYRDGSKGMQPLSAVKKPEEASEVSPISLPEDLPEIGKTVRLRPRGDHAAHIHEANITGHSFRIIAGHYEDGSLCEIFINMSKEGSTLSGIMEGLSRVVSLAIQHGVPLQDVVNQFKNLFFEPNGVTSNPNIMIAKSILDYVGRWIESKYIVEAEEDDEDYEGFEEKVLSESAEKPWRGSADLEGPLCPECGGFTQRAGTCNYCSSCGSSSGCS